MEDQGSELEKTCLPPAFFPTITSGSAEGGRALTLAEQKANAVGAENTLHHGETLLVVSARDAEPVALELIAKAVTADLLRHALVVERKPEERDLDEKRATARDSRRSLAAPPPRTVRHRLAPPLRLPGSSNGRPRARPAAWPLPPPAARACPAHIAGYCRGFSARVCCSQFLLILNGEGLLGPSLRAGNVELHNEGC